jgi:hypothetical protein
MLQVNTYGNLWNQVLGGCIPARHTLPTTLASQPECFTWQCLMRGRQLWLALGMRLFVFGMYPAKLIRSIECSIYSLGEKYFLTNLIFKMTFILIEIYRKYLNFCFRWITQSSVSSPASDDEFADAKFIRCSNHRFLTCSLF